MRCFRPTRAVALALFSAALMTGLVVTAADALLIRGGGNTAVVPNGFLLLQQGGHILLQQGGALLCHC